MPVKGTCPQSSNAITTGIIPTLELGEARNELTLCGSMRASVALRCNPMEGNVRDREPSVRYTGSRHHGAMFCTNCGQRAEGAASFCADCGARLEVTAAGGHIPRTHELNAVGPDYAGFWIRLLAWLIDAVVVGLGMALLRFGIEVADVADYGALGGGAWLVLVTPLYYVLSTGIYGRTVGKLALGMKVVRQDGHVPGLGYALLREVIGKFVSAIALFLGFLWIAWSRDKQGWHDVMAGTRVIRTA